MKDPIVRLHASVVGVRTHGPATSRTARLLRAGVKKMAKKVVEEAAEVGLDAMRGDAQAVIGESADLLYNLCVLWVECGVSPEDVFRELDRRERLLGIAEKLPKPGKHPLLGVVVAGRRSLRTG
jgi:phosphoribosyl-ATP pyrophosphohydrolase